MSSLVSFLDKKLTNVGLKFESTFRRSKNLPQYKYLTVPVYKACVRKIGPVAATAISFLSADLITHQLLPKACIHLLSKVILALIPHHSNRHSDASYSFNFLYYSYLTTLFWALFAIPVMYVKYKRTKNKLETSTQQVRDLCTTE